MRQLSLSSTLLGLMCWQPFSYVFSMDSMFYSFTQTGNVEEYTFVIRREKASHKPRAQIMVNHSAPGPTIYATLGNKVRVTVINELNDDATSVHWHGMSLIEAPWMDGVIDISQCPITNVPGYNKFTYEFIPQSTGTFWYHGHYHSQYPDGLYGALIIQSEQEKSRYNQYNINYDLDREDDIYLIADFYLDEVRNITDKFLSPQPIDIAGRDPIADSFTVNNQFSFEDNQRFNPSFDGQENIKVMPYNPNVVKSRWRLINAGAFGTYTISMDNAFFEIIEIDGVAIKSLYVNTITLHVSQRVSLIPHFTAFTPNSYFRVTLIPSYYPQYDPEAVNDALYGFTSKQGLYYEWKQKLFFDFAPDSANIVVTAADYPIIIPKDDNLFEAEPLLYLEKKNDGSPLLTVPEPTHVLLMKTSFLYYGEKNNDRVGIVKAHINDGTYSMRMSANSHTPLVPETPLLFDYIAATQSPSTRPTTSPGNYQSQLNTLHQDYHVPYNASTGNVQYIDGSGSKPYVIPYGAVVDVIIDGQCCGSHPFHPHGHHFFLIDSSTYHTDPTTSNDDYYTDPTATSPPTQQGFQRSYKPIRDVVMIPFGGWIRIRFIADNPGIWLMHCHLQWHMELGLSTLFIEGADQLHDRYYSNGKIPTNHITACDAPIARLIDNVVVEPDSVSPPTMLPTTLSPSLVPTFIPSSTKAPIMITTKTPSLRPTFTPSNVPPTGFVEVSSAVPTLVPSVKVSTTPPTSIGNSRSPTRTPSSAYNPSRTPTSTAIPTTAPSRRPTESSTTNVPTIAPTVNPDPTFVTMEFLVYGLRVSDFDQQEGVQTAFLWTVLETLPLLRAKITQTSVPSSTVPTDQLAGRNFFRVLLEAFLSVNMIGFPPSISIPPELRPIVVPPLANIDDNPQPWTGKDNKNEKTTRQLLEVEPLSHIAKTDIFKAVVTIEAEPFPEYRQAHNGGNNARRNLTDALQNLIDIAIRNGNMTETFHFYINELYYDTSTIVQKLDTIFIQQGFIFRDDNNYQPSLNPTRAPTISVSITQSQSLSQSLVSKESSLNRISELFYDDMTVSLIVVIILGITVFCVLCCITQYAYSSYLNHKSTKIHVIEGPFIGGLPTPPAVGEGNTVHPESPRPSSSYYHNNSSSNRVFPSNPAFISDSSVDYDDYDGYDDRDMSVNTTELLMRNGIPYDPNMIGMSASDSNNSTIRSTPSGSLSLTNTQLPVVPLQLNSLNTSDESTVVGVNTLKFPSPASSLGRYPHLSRS